MKEEVSKVSLYQNNPLADKQFLALLDANRERETYARIIALTFQEEPMELLEGCVTQGSINIDGASALRRTCSLTITANVSNINDYYWGLNSKFKLEIGIKNTLKTIPIGETGNNNSAYWGDKYPQDIIWFPQGIYVITAFNTTQNTNSYTINISGKDKMCLLDGSVGGALTASIDFGMEEYYDIETNTTTYTPVPIERIIKEAVHTYALEPYYNIIINDLDEIAIELLEYRGDENTPLYLLRQGDEFVNYTLNGSIKVYPAHYNDQNKLEIDKTPIELDKIEDQYLDQRVSINYVTDNENLQLFVFTPEIEDPIPYYIAKVVYGQTVGYRHTDLTYAGDLISFVGESITSILDKIKNMLGEYEYFYDIDGRFVFQRKKTYIQNAWNSIIKNGYDEYADNAAYSSAVTYRFEDSALITSFANSPNLNNLRNDFSIWGERESISGAKIPIHYRYAIDTKPISYTTVRIEPDDIPGGSNIPTQKSIEYKVGPTVDWRELIYLMAQDYYKYGQLDCYTSRLYEANHYMTTGYEQYYVDIYGFWKDISQNGVLSDRVSTEPDQLNFWFDFLDAKGELSQFSVQAIGDRVKAVKDNSVTAIYFRRVPNLIFTTRAEYEAHSKVNATGYTRVFITGAMENLFKISSQGKSAQEKVDELLYNHSYCVENVTIQSVPVYHLEPNTRIFVRDDKNKIYGDYIVSKITLPLAYNGTMSITAIKAPKQLF